MRGGEIMKANKSSYNVIDTVVTKELSEHQQMFLFRKKMEEFRKWMEKDIELSVENYKSEMLRNIEVREFLGDKHIDLLIEQKRYELEGEFMLKWGEILMLLAKML